MLGSLQKRLLGTVPKSEKELPQDRSLQIIACPGVYREVETVYQNILHNLKQDPSLKQTDIAVMVTDMARYRPVLQSVFDRRPDLLRYNLADFSAAGLSTFGHAVLGLFDLALETFTRSRVFAVLLNPCFLARLGVEREQALTWLKWAEELGIYHCWDASDKQERGYAGTPLYSWQLGLRRLRLGRLMDAGEEEADRPASAFAEVVPFTDLASSDKEQLDAFSRAVEGLLPRLAQLRDRRISGGRWAEEIRQLIDTFLDIPDDRPAEAEVRDSLFHSLGELHILDLLAETNDRQPKLPLSLMREFVADNLESVEGKRGDLLTGGVSISALRPLRPIPFRIIYILGLGEGLFPGSDVLSSFDLHSREQRRGDIRHAEANRFLLLEELLAARDKVYLLYDCKDLQRDQVLHPCGPLNQLRRYLAEHITGGAFEITQAPLSGNDLRCLGQEVDPFTDALVNYDNMERLQALAVAPQRSGLALDERAQREIDRRLQAALPCFAPPETADGAEKTTPTVRLSELRSFLHSPAEAALQRHLRLQVEDESEAADEEPFYTMAPHDRWLLHSALTDFVTRASQTTVAEALQEWPGRFAHSYEQWRLRGRVPDGAFAEVDRTRLADHLSAYIEGPDGLAQFVEARRDLECCGPVLLGESVIPVGARRRFPAPKLLAPPEVRIVGTLPLAWLGEQTFEVLVLSHASSRISGAEICNPLLQPFLFYAALKAGIDSFDGQSSSEWLGERGLVIHVSQKHGIVSFEYAAEDLSPVDARTYLTQLVRDLLDRNSFDVLPLDIILRDRALKLAYTLADDAPQLPEIRSDYYERLQDTLDQDDESGNYAIYRPPELIQVIDVRLPQDAFDKVRRRFRLLDRGPARQRANGGGG